MLWQADHSVLKLKGESDIRKKTERFKKIIETAAKQCARLAVPELKILDSCTSLISYLNEKTFQNEQLLLGSLKENRTELRNLRRPAAPWHLLIGPEGDFSVKEYQLLLDNCSATPVSLLPRVLRSETAAIAGIAMLHALWGETRTTNEVS